MASDLESICQNALARSGADGAATPVVVRQNFSLDHCVQQCLQKTLYDAQSLPADDFIGIAAYLLECISRNHCLVDGNKRFAFAVTLAYLEFQAMTLDVTNDEAAAFVQKFSADERSDCGSRAIRDWIAEHIIALG